MMQASRYGARGVHGNGMEFEMRFLGGVVPRNLTLMNVLFVVA